METIRVVLAEDSPIYAQEMERVIQSIPQVQLCGIAANGRALVDLALRVKPAVVITDIQMPEMNGIDATRALLAKLPGTKVLGVTMYSDEFLIVDMVEAGASGYLDKMSVPAYLPEAIRVVQQGLHFHCPTTSMRLAKLIGASKVKLNLADAVFSEEELQLIELMRDEFTVKEIAERMYMSESTVERRRRRLIEKTGARTPAGVVLYAIQKGLLRKR